MLTLSSISKCFARSFDQKSAGPQRGPSGCGVYWREEVVIIKNVTPPSPPKSQFLWLSSVPSRPGSPRDWPWKFEKITLSSIRPGSTTMLPKCLQSHPKVIQIAPKSDPRISKWDLWKYLFYYNKIILLHNFATQNQQSSRKFVDIGSHRRSKKSIKNRQKSIPVPSGDLLAGRAYPRMSQMATQGPKVMQKGIKKWNPNHTFRHYNNNFNGNQSGDRRQRRSLKISTLSCVFDGQFSKIPIFSAGEPGGAGWQRGRLNQYSFSYRIEKPIC